MSLAEKAAEIDAVVVGWCVPVWSDDPLPGRKQRHGLGLEDFDAVRSGYACPECLAKFNTYRAVCPVCGYRRDLEQDIVEAPDWAAYQCEQKAHDNGELPPTRSRPMHEIVDELMGGKG